ncbi:hypothetical protein QR680_017112 [Steinernema hermaphroditum]|uniref:SXP/RAL-2 family protein Ani s 5-like cation-binding domain-containing protein n=1 Tax=Steinernema hermaphroditum TaxID=289476 RepID=A0AA39LNR0_9BILA|nr:hypothetical protein QR680_017112 [Steinernema hermaphroditum]
MKTLTLLFVLVTASLARAYPEPVPYPEYPYYPHPHPLLRRFDGVRHAADVAHRDRIIGHLARKNRHANDTIERISTHLDDFQRDVSRERDLHKENFAKLSAEIDSHNAQILSLNKLIERLNAELAASKEDSLQEEKNNAILSKTLVHLYALYQRLHAKITELHILIRQQFDERIDGYSSIVASLQKEIDAQKKGRLENEQKAIDDQKLFSMESVRGHFDASSTTTAPIAETTTTTL